MKPISLTRYLIQEQHAGRINADLRLLIEVVARACKTISMAVGKGALGGVLGDAGTGNVQGEAQKKLDVLSNDILLEANAWGGHLAGLASEEMDHSQPIPDAFQRGNYLLLFDPLDGSSNIDVNISVGTIFSVLRCPDDVTTPGDEHFLQPGTAQVCAGYTTYGPSTMLVLTVGHGTHAFTLDREIGSFMMTSRDIAIPAETREFAVNMSNQRHWEPPMQAWVADMLAGKDGPRVRMRCTSATIDATQRMLKSLPRGYTSGIGCEWSISSEARPARCPPQALASSRISLLSTSSFFCASPWTLMLAPPSLPPASPSTPPSAPFPTAIEIRLQARATTSISRRRSGPMRPARCSSIRKRVREQGLPSSCGVMAHPSKRTRHCRPTAGVLAPRGR